MYCTHNDDRSTSSLFGVLHVRAGQRRPLGGALRGAAVHLNECVLELGDLRPEGTACRDRALAVHGNGREHSVLLPRGRHVVRGYSAPRARHRHVSDGGLGGEGGEHGSSARRPILRRRRGLLATLQVREGHSIEVHVVMVGQGFGCRGRLRRAGIALGR